MAQNFESLEIALVHCSKYEMYPAWLLWQLQVVITTSYCSSFITLLFLIIIMVSLLTNVLHLCVCVDNKKNVKLTLGFLSILLNEVHPKLYSAVNT